jgi:hypothetical protein
MTTKILSMLTAAVTLAYAQDIETDDPTVKITSGTTFIGKQCPDITDVRCFLGVPYATPPVGDLRFKPPQSITYTEDQITTKKHGSKCK